MSNSNKIENRTSRHTNFINSIFIIFPTVIGVVGIVGALLFPTSDERIQIIVGVASIILSLSIILLYRHWELFNTIKKLSSTVHRLSDESEKISNIKDVLSDPQNYELIECLARSFRQFSAIRDNHPELQSLVDWKRSVIHSLINDLEKDLREISIVIDDPIQELASNQLLLTTIPTQNVYAVSFEDEDFWTSQEGKGFLESHKPLLENGVSITRIFLTDGDVLGNFNRLIKDQKEIGINVYSLDASRAAELSGNLDFVIYDEKILRRGYNPEFTRGNMYKHALITANRSEVEKYFQLFNVLLTRAEEVL